MFCRQTHNKETTVDVQSKFKRLRGQKHRFITTCIAPKGRDILSKALVSKQYILIMFCLFILLFFPA